MTDVISVIPDKPAKRARPEIHELAIESGFRCSVIPVDAGIQSNKQSAQRTPYFFG